SIWIFGWKNEAEELVHETNLDQISINTFSRIGNSAMTYVSTNGTLWASFWSGTNFSKFRQLGAETNWVAVAAANSKLVALKNDGTLWKWDLHYEELGQKLVASSPVRFGIHNDWVAVVGMWDGVVSIAADGSLWYWLPSYYGWEYNGDYASLMKPPKQPEFLGNVFGKAD